MPSPTPDECRHVCRLSCLVAGGRQTAQSPIPRIPPPAGYRSPAAAARARVLSLAGALAERLRPPPVPPGAPAPSRARGRTVPPRLLPVLPEMASAGCLDRSGSAWWSPAALAGRYQLSAPSESVVLPGSPAASAWAGVPPPTPDGRSVQLWESCLADACDVLVAASAPGFGPRQSLRACLRAAFRRPDGILRGECLSVSRAWWDRFGGRAAFASALESCGLEPWEDEPQGGGRPVFRYRLSAGVLQSAARRMRHELDGGVFDSERAFESSSGLGGLEVMLLPDLRGESAADFPEPWRIVRG